MLFETDAELVRSLCFSYLNEMATNSRLACSRLERHFHPPPPPRRRLFAVISLLSLMTFPALSLDLFSNGNFVDSEFHDPAQRSTVLTSASPQVTFLRGQTGGLIFQCLQFLSIIYLIVRNVAIRYFVATFATNLWLVHVFF